MEIAITVLLSFAGILLGYYLGEKSSKRREKREEKKEAISVLRKVAGEVFPFVLSGIRNKWRILDLEQAEIKAKRYEHLLTIQNAQTYFSDQRGLYFALEYLRLSIIEASAKDAKMPGEIEYQLARGYTDALSTLTFDPDKIKYEIFAALEHYEKELID